MLVGAFRRTEETTLCGKSGGWQLSHPIQSYLGGPTSVSCAVLVGLRQVKRTPRQKLDHLDHHHHATFNE